MGGEWGGGGCGVAKVRVGSCVDAALLSESQDSVGRSSGQTGDPHRNQSVPKVTSCI